MKANILKSRNQREGKYLTQRQYKLGNYSRKRTKKDYTWFKAAPANCTCCGS